MKPQTSPKAASHDQAQAQAQHPPPPPLPSSAAPPLDPPSSSNPIWPEGYILFLDPLSMSAIPKIVQNLSKFTYYNPPRQTAILSEATHIVIDPTSPFGEAVLQLQAQLPPPASSRPPQLLVTDNWLKECIFWEEWLGEREFLFVREGKEEEGEGEKREGKGGSRGKGSKDEVEMEKPGEAEGGKDSDEDRSDDPPDLPSSGRWLRSEDDALARFLLPLEDRFAEDENGLNAFDRFALTKLTRRTGPVLRERYKTYETEFQAKLELLKGLGRARGKSTGKGKGKERASSSPAHGSVDGEESHATGGQRRRGKGSGIRDAYTAQEKLDFENCLRSTSSPSDAFRKMSALHKERFQEALRALEERSHPIPSSSASKRSLDEVDDPVPSSSKQPRLEVSSPSHVGSGSNSNSAPSLPHHRPPSTPSPASTNSQNQTLPDSDSDSETEFEPPSFLQLGVAPSALSSSSPSCYWCGTGDDESSYFKMLELAEEDPSDPQGITNVDVRLACSFCVKRTEKWVARGESEEMGELERLAWLGRKLEYTGRKERATLVRVEEGGTARED